MRTGRVQFSAWLIGAWLIACALWLGGCLNPMPDDFPSGRESESADVMDGAGPERPGSEGDPVPLPPEDPPLGVEDADGSPSGAPGTSAPDAGTAATDGGPPADGDP